MQPPPGHQNDDDLRDDHQRSDDDLLSPQQQQQQQQELVEAEVGGNAGGGGPEQEQDSSSKGDGGGPDLPSHVVGGGNMRDTRARRDQAANLQKVALIAAASDAVNDKAVQVLTRVSCKLSGLDFPTISADSLAVEAQVELLIQQAISHENLCQSFVGWCPFW